MAHTRRPAVLAGGWLVAAWLSFISLGCTAHPFGTPGEVDLVAAGWLGSAAGAYAYAFRLREIAAR